MSERQKHVLIGAYEARGEVHALPVSRGDIDRATDSYLRVLQTYGFRNRQCLLSISRARESAMVLPLERAATTAGLIICNADSVIFEAQRVSMFLRRFDVAAVAGLSAEVLDGLEAGGHDVDKLLAGKVVWARPGAYERLAGRPGVVLRRWLTFGPVLALECAEGQGVHVDTYEWEIAAGDGEIEVSSRLDRAMPLKGLKTGMTGRIEARPCGCGSPDPRVLDAAEG